MVTKDIRYIGVNDRDIDLFEGQYPVPNGIAYNSYVILDEKVAVMDTVDHRKQGEFLANLEAALDGRKPDYLVVHHVEPDHASSVQAVLDQYPDITVVAGAAALPLSGYRACSAGPPRAPVYRRPHGALARGHDEL